MIRSYVLFFLALLFVACADSDYNNYVDSLVDSMEWLRSADPIKDANGAVEKNDNRYLAVTGYSLTFPGLPEDVIPDANNKDEYKIIGFCELTEGKEHMDLCDLAANYAELYNKRILELKRKKGKGDGGN